MLWAVARSAGSIVFFDSDPGACAPGFMLSPASQVQNLKHKPETETYLTWDLSREWLIESRISRDTAVGKTCQDLAREPASEHGPESVQLA